MSILNRGVDRERASDASERAGDAYVATNLERSRRAVVLPTPEPVHELPATIRAREIAEEQRRANSHAARVDAQASAAEYNRLRNEALRPFAELRDRLLPELLREAREAEGVALADLDVDGYVDAHLRANALEDLARTRRIDSVIRAKFTNWKPQ